MTHRMGDGDKSHKLYFTPAAWLSCLSTSDGVMAFTEGEWQNWFCSFLGVPLPSMLTLIANRDEAILKEVVSPGLIAANTCVDMMCVSIIRATTGALPIVGDEGQHGRQR